MVISQFLIAFLILNVRNSSCQYSLETEESFVELGLFQKVLYKYSIYLGGDQSCRTMIETDSRSQYSVYPIFDADDCHGAISNCQWSGEVSACGSRIGRNKLQWIEEVRNGQRYIYPSKNSGTCIEEKGLAQYKTNVYHNVCNCDCFHINWAIYIGRMYSRESDHRVIVGLRFILRDNVLYLQPADAKLEDNQQLYGFAWVPLPIDAFEYRRVTSDSANFFLDDFILSYGYALTGVQLVYMETTRGTVVKGFGISVSGRPFSETGGLVLQAANTLTIRPRPDTVRYVEADVIVLRNAEGGPFNTSSGENYEYVELKQSDKEVDYGQTTVPLLHNPPIPFPEKLLAGFGIFYEMTKSRERFITLRFHESEDYRQLNSRREEGSN